MPEGTEGQESQTPPQQAPTPQTPPEKTFTQAELDEILKQRLARAVPADYDDLKSKAQKLDELEAANKTEVERALAKAEKAEKERSETEARANATLKRAAIIEAAASQNAADTSVVVALLINSEDVTIGKDGEITGAEKAVKDLLKEKPFLVKGQSAGASGGEFGGESPKGLADQIAAAEAKGDYDAAMRLKLAGNQGL